MPVRLAFVQLWARGGHISGIRPLLRAPTWTSIAPPPPPGVVRDPAQHSTTSCVACGSELHGGPGPPLVCVCLTGISSVVQAGRRTGLLCPRLTCTGPAQPRSPHNWQPIIPVALGPHALRASAGSALRPTGRQCAQTSGAGIVRASARKSAPKDRSGAHMSFF